MIAKYIFTLLKSVGVWRELLKQLVVFDVFQFEVDMGWAIAVSQNKHTITFHNRLKTGKQIFALIDLIDTKAN